MKKLSLILMLCGVVCLPAVLADVVKLKSGGTIQGEIIDETADEVTVKTGGGQMKVPRANIASIELTEDLYDTYREKLAATKPYDAEAHYKLGLWCRESGLETESVERFEKVLMLNPNHDAARKALGYEVEGGEWVRRAKTGEPLAEPVDEPDDEADDGQTVVEHPDPPVDPPAVPKPDDKNDIAEGDPEGGKTEPETEGTDTRTEAEKKRDRAIEEFDRRHSTWKTAYEVKSAHYLVKTNAGKRVGDRAALAMERLYYTYKERFGIAGRPSRLEVYIFRTQSEFLNYSWKEGVFISRGVLGYYRFSGGKEIVTFYNEGEFNTFAVLFHEGTHQFVDLVCSKPPIWVNEGLAVYFENSVFEGRQLVTNIPRSRLIQLQGVIKSGDFIPLDQLIATEPWAFGSLHYAEAWSLIYFFVNADEGRYAKRFDYYFKRLKQGTSNEEAFKKAFSSDFVGLEKRWKEFVLALAVPADGKAPPEIRDK